MANEGKGLVRRGTGILESVKPLLDDKADGKSVFKAGAIVAGIAVGVPVGGYELVNVATGPVNSLMSSATGEWGVISAGAAVGVAGLISAVGYISEKEARGSQAKEAAARRANGLLSKASRGSLVVGTGAALLGGFMEVTGHGSPGTAFHVTEAAAITGATGVIGTKAWGKRIRAQALAGN